VDATPIAKILPRSPTVGVIARPALEELVATARNRRLTVVVAEAGFGKSTLLASWWETAPCAWYTADHRDLDLPTLGRQLSDALRLRVPDIPSDVSWLAEGAGGPELEQFLRADTLAAQFAEILHAQLSTDLILVIDDAHELEQSSPRLGSSRPSAGMHRRASTWSSPAGGSRHSRSSACVDRDSSSRSTVVSSRSPLWRWRSWWRIGSASTPSSWPRKFTASPVGGRRP